MLVLSRKSQESVIVGGSDGVRKLLKVTILEVSHGRVKLGFEVDEGVPVHRWEVWERTHANCNSQGVSLVSEDRHSGL